MSELFDRYERALRRGWAAGGGSVSISGAGRIAGGTYESVSIAGSGTVEGDLSAREVEVSGSASFRGSVSAEEVSVSGAVRVHGGVKAGIFKAAGALSVEGLLEASSTVKIAGALQAKGVRAPEVRISGSFDVEEGIEGEVVELRLSSDSRAAVIKGGEVRVRREGKVKPFTLLEKLLRLRRVPEFKVGRIEAKTLLVEDVLVSGDVKAERVELVGQAEVKGQLEGEVARRPSR